MRPLSKISEPQAQGYSANSTGNQRLHHAAPAKIGIGMGSGRQQTADNRIHGRGTDLGSRFFSRSTIDAIPAHFLIIASAVNELTRATTVRHLEGLFSSYGTREILSKSPESQHLLPRTESRIYKNSTHLGASAGSKFPPIHAHTVKSPQRLLQRTPHPGNGVEPTYSKRKSPWNSRRDTGPSTTPTFAVQQALDVQSQPNLVLSCLETVTFAPVLNASTSRARQTWSPNPWNGPIVPQEPALAGWNYRKSFSVPPLFVCAHSGLQPDGLHLSKPPPHVAPDRGSFQNRGCEAQF
ncbi:hypothetical protein CPLU01_02848 [Colletotrichum plurivorum]|uniref:Uncharacterized protein n=1 Tax=Colletotrichum plurivorum TaxID=2175906 RepID=A0A8H6NLF6_9PEZI|nr:hypothetical protein CPLU01_02848 [Colletotrichum plurivorum]